MFAYWFLHSSVDWLWEFPGIAGVGLAALGIAGAVNRGLQAEEATSAEAKRPILAARPALALGWRARRSWPCRSSRRGFPHGNSAESSWPSPIPLPPSGTSSAPRTGTPSHRRTRPPASSRSAGATHGRDPPVQPSPRTRPGRLEPVAVPRRHRLGRRSQAGGPEACREGEPAGPPRSRGGRPCPVRPAPLRRSHPTDGRQVQPGGPTRSSRPRLSCVQLERRAFSIDNLRPDSGRPRRGLRGRRQR